MRLATSDVRVSAAFADHRARHRAKAIVGRCDQRDDVGGDALHAVRRVDGAPLHDAAALDQPVSNRVHGAVGALAFAVVLATALGGIAAASAVDEAVTGRDLEVFVEGPRPFQLGRASREGPTVLPPEIRGRVDETNHPGGGMDLRVWHTTYAKRWEREVSLPVLGPLRSGAEATCGYEVALRQEMLDTRFAEGLAGILLPHAQRAIDEANAKLEAVERSGALESTSFRFPRVRSISLVPKVGGGQVAVQLVIDFGSGRSLTFSFAVVLESERGLLRPRLAGRARVEPSPVLLDEVQTQVARDHGFVCSFWPFVDCKRAVSSKVQSEGASAVAALVELVGKAAAKAQELPSPVAGRPGDTYAVTLQRDPLADDGVLSFPLCLAATLSAPLRDTAVSGYVLAPATQASPTTPHHARPAGLTLTATPDALNHLLYLAWQTDFLGTLGRSSAVLDGLPAEARKLAFTFSGLDPQLPPALSNFRTDSATLSVLSVKVGTWDRRDVVGHARLGISLSAGGSAVTVRATPLFLSANCTQGQGRHGFLLTPCLSDLLPGVRERASLQQLEHTLDLGDKLLPLGRKMGVGLELHEVTTELHPGGLRATATVRLIAP